jgi:hypothetical protein
VVEALRGVLASPDPRAELRRMIGVAEPRQVAASEVVTRADFDRFRVELLLERHAGVPLDDEEREFALGLAPDVASRWLASREPNADRIRCCTVDEVEARRPEEARDERVLAAVEPYCPTVREEAAAALFESVGIDVKEVE